MIAPACHPLKTAALTLGLIFMHAAGAQDSAPEMKLTLPGGRITVLVDADRLGPAPHYASTVAFVFQLDPHAGRSEADIRLATETLDKNTALHPGLKQKMREDLRALAVLLATAREKPGSTNAADLKPFLDHLALHQVTPERVEAVRQACIRIIAARPATNNLAPTPF